MSDETERLGLPYLMPAQAMKHVTHNEAVQRIDAAVHLAIDLIASIPLGTPDEGFTCLVGANPEHDWTGRAGQIAFWQDGAWQYLQPRDGWIAWFKQDACFKVFNDAHWQDLPLTSIVEFDRLGIGASPDATNRFALSSDAALLTHGMNGSHQLKINKQAAENTASLLFQSGWTGHAEMGLAGNNAFSIKQSPDGSNWYSALILSGNGIPSFPNRPIMVASHSSSNFAASPSSRSGFSSFSLNQGGFTLGSVVAGSMYDINVPANGYYLAMLHFVTASATSNHSVFIAVNASQRGNAIEAATSSAPHSHSLVTLLDLTANDKISLGYSGTSTVTFGSGKTELTLLHLG